MAVQSDSSSYWIQFILVPVHASSSSDGWARARRRHLCGMRELLTTHTRRDDRLSSSSYWFQLILVPVHTGSSPTYSSSYWLESWLASCWPGCRSGSARWRGFQYSRSLGSPQSVRFRRFCSGFQRSRSVNCPPERHMRVWTFGLRMLSLMRSLHDTLASGSVPKKMLAKLSNGF